MHQPRVAGSGDIVRRRTTRVPACEVVGDRSVIIVE
jgi:hypothetical protein